MKNTIEKKATEILVNIFTQAGWRGSKENIKKLEKAITCFIDESRRVTEEENSSGYAIISRRIMKSVHNNKITGPSNTMMGKLLFRAEKKMIKVMEDIDVYDYFDGIPQFTLLVNEERGKNKISRVLLWYSIDFGFNLQLEVAEPPYEK